MRGVGATATYMLLANPGGRFAIGGTPAVDYLVGGTLGDQINGARTSVR